MNQNRAYYSHFNTSILLGAKELLKSMPAVYTRIYFSSKYINAFLNGDEEEFINLTVLTEAENIETIKNIVKTNSLYISDWDSLKYTNGEDFGFSFIAGNVKYVVLPFIEKEDGFLVRSYDVDTGDCYETHLDADKQHFLNVTITDNGDFIRTADFNLEYMNDINTNKFRAEKKAGPELIVVEDKKGYALTNMYLIGMLLILCVLVVSITAYLFKTFIIG